MPLSVVLSNTAGVPIYEQIAQQVRDAILTGQVEADEMLPSIRALARDLRVSVITTTRAYSDLVAEGFLANVPWQGLLRPSSGLRAGARAGAAGGRGAPRPCRGARTPGPAQ